MRRRTLHLLLLALLASTGGVFAQPSFIDVPEGHWAADAVDRIADLGIVIGHPDGTFLGDDAFTRYQAAVVVGRLLDVIDRNIGAMAAFADDDIDVLRDAVARLDGELSALRARVSALETGDTGETAPVRVAQLERRVESLSAEVERLREALAEVQPASGPVGTRGPEGSPGTGAPSTKGPVGPRGPAGAAGESAPGDGAPGEGAAGPVQEPGRAAMPGVGTREEPLFEPTPDAGDERTGTGSATPLAERSPFYLGFAAVSESNDRVPLRLVAGYDDLLGPIGLRATIDYGRQSPNDARAISVAAHLTHRMPLGDGRVRGYLGLGGGVQVDAAGAGQAAEGAFASGLLGLEIGLFGPTSAFVEGMVDSYANEPAGAPGYAYGRLYPTVAAGIAVRF
ncbi:MAG: S-layer homology domain-containing protein [Trueperaceae bacterium]|nr:S-layer homology domain-containing protein [Trueperaceae bacterium]